MENARNWIGDVFSNDIDADDPRVSMKAMLSVLFDEAFRIAVVDSIDPDLIDDAGRCAVYKDVYTITKEQWASIDPMALSKNTRNRFIGVGGWEVRGRYAPNCTPREVFDATIGGPDMDLIAGIKEQLRNMMDDCGETVADSEP